MAANEAGADRYVYKVGGAQAIAALGLWNRKYSEGRQDCRTWKYLCGTWRKKRAVYGHVSIDAIAGPSEILVIADETANPRYVAADLLSQAEHDELASAILVTTSQELAEKVSEEVDGFLKELSRSEDHPQITG